MKREKRIWNPVRLSEAPLLIKWVEGYLDLPDRSILSADQRQNSGEGIPPRARNIGGWLVDDDMPNHPG